MLGQAAGAGQHARISAGVGLIEDDAGVVGDVALQAVSITLQHAGRDRGAAFVGVTAAEDERATALLGQAAGANDICAKACPLSKGIKNGSAIIDEGVIK